MKLSIVFCFSIVLFFFAPAQEDKLPQDQPMRHSSQNSFKISSQASEHSNLDYRVKTLIKQGAELKEINQGFLFTEGPAADKEGNVYFTDQPNNRILRWDAITHEINTFLEPSGRSNGLYFGEDGRLYACADEKFELWKIDMSKNRTVLLKAYENKFFNGPNDLCVDSKGGIYFTDPYYQRPYWKREKGALESQDVYYLKPGMKTVVRVIDDFVQPNGLIGTSDGKKLYVSDIGDSKTYSFDVNEDGGLSNKALFVNMGSDGMTLDNHGNLYLTNQNGVTAFNTNGEQVLNIPIPKEWTSNVTFGGIDNNILFITAMDAVFTLEMNAKGIK